MSRPHSKPGPGSQRKEQYGVINQFVENLHKYLRGDSMELVKQIFDDENIYNSLKRDIKSESSYRRVHELLSSVIDHAERLISQGQKVEDIRRQLATELAKVRIIIKYQEARGQIHSNIAKLLENAIRELYSDDIRDPKVLKNVLSNARILIDALAVIAKE
ncbi:MAG: hypothetical protein ACP5NQ_04720 [Vulcanisaeta sp.]